MSRQSAVERIEASHRLASDDRLHAFTVLNAEPFVSRPDLPLDGVAVGVKDLYDTAALVTTYGSPIYKDNVPAKDAWLVGRLKELGAYVLGKTVTTEFAWRHAGPTVNPHHPAHTPGGSSSGSAAAVAAGIVPIALGTQTFGSIIRPAAFCGIVGFKPSYGVLPLEGVHPLSQSLDHAGYLGQSVKMIEKVHGHVVGGSAEAARRGKRIRLIRGPYWGQASDTQKLTVEASARRLEHAGYEVVAQELPPQFDDALALAEAVLAYESDTNFGSLVARHRDLVSAHLRDLVRKGEAIAEVDYRDVLVARDELKYQFAREMDGFDAVLSLPALGEAPLLSESTGNAAPCVLWTLLGLPAVTLPSAMGENGLPLGIQLIGMEGRDFALLDLAADVEAYIR